VISSGSNALLYTFISSSCPSKKPANQFLVPIFNTDVISVCLVPVGVSASVTETEALLI